ncbi:MAG: SRPBCC family protein [Chloroflexi bacterium]|nr:SRPBCC family protein [Chloroflexota bacterium]
MSKLKSFTILGALAGTLTIAVYVKRVRPWSLRWGARRSEIKRVYPGDELVPHPRLNATRAITIHAPVETVWQWLVQIGQGRGGFYTYDWIENLMGLDMRSADHIVPEWQTLMVGDIVPLAPGGFGIPVAIREPNRAFVLFGDSREDAAMKEMTAAGNFFTALWGWHLVALDDHTTRLIERWCADWNPSLFNTIFMRAFLEPGAFIMSRGMMLGIKARAEKTDR